MMPYEKLCDVNLRCDATSSYNICAGFVFGLLRLPLTVVRGGLYSLNTYYYNTTFIRTAISPRNLAWPKLISMKELI